MVFRHLGDPHYGSETFQLVQHVGHEGDAQKGSEDFVDAPHAAAFARRHHDGADSSDGVPPIWGGRGGRIRSGG